MYRLDIALNREQNKQKQFIFPEMLSLIIITWDYNLGCKKQKPEIREISDLI